MQATDPPQHLHVSLVGSPASLDRQSRFGMLCPSWECPRHPSQMDMVIQSFSGASNTILTDFNWHTSIFCFWFEKKLKKVIYHGKV